MKCSIMLHFIGVFTVCKGKKDLQPKEHNLSLKIKTSGDPPPPPPPPRYVQWNITSLLYQTRRKTPLVYKGVKYV